MLCAASLAETGQCLNGYLRIKRLEQLDNE